MNMNIDLLNKEIKKKTKIFCISPIIPSFSSVLKEVDFFTENNIRIQKKLKEIVFFSCYFYCFQECNSVSLNSVNEYKIEEKQMNKKYVVFKYLKEEKRYFIDYFSSNKLYLDKKNYIRNLFISFNQLLKITIEMNKKAICYFDWKRENIFFNEKAYIKLESFENCIDYAFITHEYIEKLIINKSEKDLYYTPLEVIIIYYMIKKDYFTLSSAILNEIYDYVKKRQFISISYPEFISLFQIYINHSRKEIIIQLSKYINTWDNYGLTIIYIHYLEEYIKNNPYDTKYHFIPKWLLLLKKNFSNNPLQRESLIQTQEKFQDLFTF